MAPTGLLNTALMLKNMFDPGTVDLAEDPDFYTDVQEDVTEECGKHGPVAQVHVDKTSPDGQVLGILEMIAMTEFSPVKLTKSFCLLNETFHCKSVPRCTLFRTDLCNQ